MDPIKNPFSPGAGAPPGPTTARRPATAPPTPRFLGSLKRGFSLDDSGGFFLIGTLSLALRSVTDATQKEAPTDDDNSSKRNTVNVIRFGVSTTTTPK